MQTTTCKWAACGLAVPPYQRAKPIYLPSNATDASRGRPPAFFETLARPSTLRASQREFPRNSHRFPTSGIPGLGIPPHYFCLYHNTIIESNINGVRECEFPSSINSFRKRAHCAAKGASAMASEDFYCRYYTGHKGKFGHEYMEFEFLPNGLMK